MYSCHYGSLVVYAMTLSVISGAILTVIMTFTMPKTPLTGAGRLGVLGGGCRVAAHFTNRLDADSRRAVSSEQ